MWSYSRISGAAALCAVVAGFVLVAGSVSSMAQDTLERLREQGFARIAIANEPPYTEVTSDGKVTGAAPEIARAVLKRLGINEVVASISEYGAMIPGLQARRFDMVAAGLFIKPERCEAVLFSEPDVCDAEALLIKKGNPLKLESYEDIARHPTAKIGVPGGGTEERLALERGVPRDRVVVVQDGQSGLKMVQNERLAAYSLPVLSIADLIKKANDPDLEMVAPVKNTPIHCAGVAFRKEDRALRDAYDAALAELKRSGEFEEILDSFGMSAEAPLQTSREELCGGPN